MSRFEELHRKNISSFYLSCGHGRPSSQQNWGAVAQYKLKDCRVNLGIGDCWDGAVVVWCKEAEFTERFFSYGEHLKSMVILVSIGVDVPVDVQKRKKTIKKHRSLCNSRVDGFLALYYFFNEF